MKELIKAVEILGEILMRESPRELCGSDMNEGCKDCGQYLFCKGCAEFNNALAEARKQIV